MTRRRGFVVATVVILCASFLGRNAIAQAMVTFEAPHHAHAPVGKMNATLAARIDADAKNADLTTADGVIHFALGETAARFHFGLSHKTKLAYDDTEREGNCVEYADLFAAIVNREASGVRAYAVRSDARILGEKMADPAWKDHDWVLLVTPSGRFFADPTLYDMGFGWNIARAVRGTVPTG